MIVVLKNLVYSSGGVCGRSEKAGNLKDTFRGRKSLETPLIDEEACCVVDPSSSIAVTRHPLGGDNMVRHPILDLVEVPASMEGVEVSNSPAANWNAGVIDRKERSYICRAHEAQPNNLNTMICSTT